MRDPIRITTVTRQWWRLRRWLSPIEWLVWWLGVPRSTLPPTTTGLILIRIDGLAPDQLHTALAQGRLPSLAGMTTREHYQARYLNDHPESDLLPFRFDVANRDPAETTALASRDLPLSRHWRSLERVWRARWQFASLMARMGIPGTSAWPKSDQQVRLATNRSLATTATQIDCARGVTLIPIRLTGYGQMAMQSGPGSEEALHQLQDIDRSVGRIWHTAHAGAGREYDLWIYSCAGAGDSAGCLLAPADITDQVPEPAAWRWSDLQQAVERFQKRAIAEAAPGRSATPLQVRIMSYNVHACVGMDGELSTARIARVISQSSAELVCLQELDVHRSRSRFVDQAQSIAQELGMHHAFFAAKEHGREQFGNAVLSRFPMRLVRSALLDQEHPERSKRAAMWLAVDRGDFAIQIINTHLSIYPREQLQQARQLVADWIAPARRLGPVIVCGDFNARPGSATHQALETALRDVESFDQEATRPTYFSPFPLSRFDHIFVSEEWQSARVRVLDSRLAQTASDHLPLIADLTLPATARSVPLPREAPS